ncbi:MAG: transposase [Flavobacteriales bacterium]|nr:transposase [Flavobacteriales bacterium]
MKHWIGVDVSKAHLDVALLMKPEHYWHRRGSVTSPKRSGIMRRWGKEFRLDKSSMLVCLEPTGHYGYRLVEELVHLAIPTWLAHPLDIKHSIGNTRGKSDGIDALRIADYARRYQDKARLVGAEALRMNKLRQLLPAGASWSPSAGGNKCGSRTPTGIWTVPSKPLRPHESPTHQAG